MPEEKINNRHYCIRVTKYAAAITAFAQQYQKIKEAYDRRLSCGSMYVYIPINRQKFLTRSLLQNKLGHVGCI